ncbi:MAG: hypothetical protein HYU86_01525 [Chloroflexi bacterium]|nr:hypothetical protein [Chloroflexota bacterium]
METLERLGVIILLLKAAQERQFKLFHAHVQKLVYLLQEAKRVPLGYNFKMHYFGPYSEELWGTLNILKSWDTVKVEMVQSHGSYGHLINPGDKVSEFLDLIEKNKNNQTWRTYEDRVTELLELVGSRDARGIELIGTVHFMHKLLKAQGQADNSETVIDRVRKLKPHFSEAEVSEALNELREKLLL